MDEGNPTLSMKILGVFSGFIHIQPVDSFKKLELVRESGIYSLGGFYLECEIEMRCVIFILEVEENC